MEFWSVILIAIGLAMDAFAVSLAVGTSGKNRDLRSIIRIAFHLGFFQGFMTFLGWLGGSTISRLIEKFDHWVALVLLSFVGIRMIISGLNPDQESFCKDPSRGSTLVLICLATSIDALAVGISLAVVQVNMLSTSLTIGIITLGLSLGGLLFGHLLGEKLGKRMEVLGGLLLNGIGIRILLSHLF